MQRSVGAKRLGAQLLLVLMLCAAPSVYSFPGRFVSTFGNGVCTSQPVLGRTYSPHRTVQADSTITFTLTTANGDAVTSVCPGTTLSLAVGLPGGRGYLLTASQGALGTVPDSTCPNRLLSALTAATLNTQLAVPCAATGSIDLVITTATGAGQAHLQNSVNFPVDTSCAASSCASGGSGSTPGSTPSPAPAPAPPAANGTLSASQQALVASVNMAAGCNTISNPYAYQCTRQAPASDMIIAYTVSASPVPPVNPCTQASIQGARALALPAGTNAWLHAMFTSAAPGWISVAFAGTAGKMYPADAVLGGVDPDKGAYVDTYRLSEYELGESSADLGTRWAYNLGAYQQTNPVRRTVVCFSRSVYVPTTGTPTPPTANNGRRLLDDDNSGGAQVTPSTVTLDTLLQMNWAVNDIDEEDQKHTGTGAFTLNWVTGEVVNKGNALKDKSTVHGALMLTAFVGLMPLAALLARHKGLVPKVQVAGKDIWFWLHVALQVIATGLFAGSVGLALAEFPRNNMPEHDSVLRAHYIIGVILIALVGIQLLIGGIRPTPHHPKRWAWNLLHHNWGRVIILLGLANVGLGIYLFQTLFKWTAQLTGAAEPYKAWTIAAAVILGVYLLAAVVLEFKSAAVRAADNEAAEAKIVAAAAGAGAGRGPRQTDMSGDSDEGAQAKLKSLDAGSSSDGGPDPTAVRVQ